MLETTLRAGPNVTSGRDYRGGQLGRRSRGRPPVIAVLAGVVVRLRFLAAEAEMPDGEGMAGCHQWDAPPRRGPAARSWLAGRISLLLDDRITHAGTLSGE